MAKYWNVFLKYVESWRATVVKSGELEHVYRRSRGQTYKTSSKLAVAEQMYIYRMFKGAVYTIKQKGVGNIKEILKKNGLNATRLPLQFYLVLY